MVENVGKVLSFEDKFMIKQMNDWFFDWLIFNTKITQVRRLRKENEAALAASIQRIEKSLESKVKHTSLIIEIVDLTINQHITTGENLLTYRISFCWKK